MKPLRLEAEGFTCYRDRQPPLDFSGLSLFAIAGPTGAGKSSILDTILFALYGEVPRIGKQGIGEFIAHGRDRMSVTLDFSVRGVRYRVSRQVKRGRKNALSTTAMLVELPADGGPEKSLADGVKPVNEQVERLLGLDFDAFTQTVILPQGEFAKFLRSEPKDQRAILQHLLRHDIFTRMREDAERRRIEISGELGGVERELKAFEAATPEALAQVLTLYPDLEQDRIVHETVRRVMSAMVGDVIAETKRRAERLNPRSAQQVRALGQPLVSFGPQMAEKNRVLQSFLNERMYRHERVEEIMARARRVMHDLFDAYMQDPKLLPQNWQADALPADRSHYARQVCDFIAGMTDRYALDQHKRLFDLDPLFR